ncbi:MAG: LysM peptidoglycan-binding domain-containing protein [Nitrospirae bacterium]|nr:MAG: LysM peptidoglycan-binding domain-containing protein [Nitrospirota bacterium]
MFMTHTTTKEGCQAGRVPYRAWTANLVILALLGSLTACVSSEKYEAEKARALNFQRLLAQEEKRTGELNAQIQEAQQKMAELEAKNRDLTMELQALREQLARQQEAMTQQQEAALPDDETLSAEEPTLSEESLADLGLEDLSFEESDFQELSASAATATEPISSTPAAAATEPIYYTVKKGDTLYRISREYGVTVDDLKKWNHLDSDLIAIGQKLIVSQP